VRVRRRHRVSVQQFGKLIRGELKLKLELLVCPD